MTVLLVVALAWVALALPLGLLLGRGLSWADARESAARLRSPVPDYVPADLVESVAAQQRRRG